jgi:hypothetical protein
VDILKEKEMVPIDALYLQSGLQQQQRGSSDIKS